MIGGQPVIDAFPEREIRNVARAWASSYGYTLKEPLTIVPLLTLVPDSEGKQIMRTWLEGWNVFAQAQPKAADREVTIMFSLKRLANSVVPDEEPREC